MNNTGSCSQHYSSTKQTDSTEIFIFLEDTKRHSGVSRVEVFREEEGGEVSFNSFCQQKGPLTAVTVKIKIIYFLESDSGVWGSSPGQRYFRIGYASQN